MNILVTGATGFLGRFIVKALIDQGHQVTSFGSKECDLTSDDSLNQYNHIKFDQIYHLAAWVQAGDFNLLHQGEIFLINQKINTNVLAWWHKRQRQAKMITMGTSCSYEAEAKLVEDNYLLGLPHDSLFAYAMTKRMLYTGLLSLHRQFNMQYLYLIPSTLYGAGYHDDNRQLHFIFDLIRKILQAKYHEDKVELWGDGHQKRELVYIDDFVNTMLNLSENVSNDIINIGAGSEYSIREFAKNICDIVDYDFEKVTYDTSKYVGAKSKCLDITKLRECIPNYKTTPLRNGLKRSIDWFSKAYFDKALV